MVYTCYDMIRDCRAEKPEGWAHFATAYGPVVALVAEHYAPARRAESGVVEGLLRDAKERAFFAGLDPIPERPFVAALRNFVIDRIAPPGETPLELEQLSAAFEPLSAMERQAVWLETMRYAPADAGRMLRMAPETVEAVRAKAGEQLRGQTDSWSRGMLGRDGRALGAAAANAATGDCISARVLLEIADGQSTWNKRTDAEFHLLRCWHCVDHSCRLLEAIDLLRRAEPASEAEAARRRAAVGGAEPEAPGLWKRLFNRR